MDAIGWVWMMISKLGRSYHLGPLDLSFAVGCCDHLRSNELILILYPRRELVPP